jgi:hypothetical protein
MTRGDVSASIAVVPELSRPQPPIGSAPDASPGFVVVRLRAINKGARVREFDALVGFPSVTEAHFAAGTDVEKLGGVQDIIAQPGSLYLLGGQGRMPMRLYPDIETSVFVRISMPPPSKRETIAGFVGLFDAAATSDTTAQALRFPLIVTAEPATATYESDWSEHGSKEMEVTQYSKACLGFSLGMCPPFAETRSKHRVIGGVKGTRRTGPFKLVQIGAATEAKRDAEPMWPTSPAEEAPTRRVLSTDDAADGDQ